MLALLLALLPLPPQDSYLEPHPSIVAVVDAPPPPSVRISPDGAWMLLVEQDAMPSIADMARPMLRLAGMRIDPAARSRWQSSFDVGLSLRPLAGGETTRVPLPEGARLASVSWAPDSAHFAYVLVTDEGSQLWAACTAYPTQARLVSSRVNRVLGGFDWLPGEEALELLVHEVPADLGDPPAAPAAPRGPAIEETSGASSPRRTYQDLLSDAHDEALFRHYATSRLARVDAHTLARTAVGEPGLVDRVEPSPDGSLWLVETLTGETSYQVPYGDFPHRVEVWSPDGRLRATVAEVPLAEGIPIGGVRTGRRGVDWLESRDATLVWTEALDGGDPEAEVPHRDRVVAWEAPFDAEPAELLRVEHRAWGVSALEDPTLLVTSEYDRDRRWTRVLVHDLSDPDAAPLVLEDRSIRDRYADPGNLVRHTDARGRTLPLQQGPWVHLAGQGASPEGLLPFLDRLNLETGEKERLWRCAPGAYETVVDLLPEGGGVALITRHETPTSPPNYHLRRPGAAEPVALTDFPDPTPQIRGVTKELVTYPREDGVQLSATLYLPADHEEGERLPLLVWAYPREYNDPATASQIGTSPWRFTRIYGASHLALVQRGYAVLDGATMPVIGDPETMNDTFREQIVAAARAAIDYAVERGVADRERVGVGGHSYGAFMTANLLAHSDLFAAGVARSGAYNRTLTPFGFQSERRTFWEAPDAYFELSPFMHADQIDEPLLLVHGEQDNNSGTYPLQSRRLFAAIQGHGGTARLVMLPLESHGYRARESVLHTLAEMELWFDRYLKGPRPSEAGAPRGSR